MFFLFFIYFRQFMQFWQSLFYINHIANYTLCRQMLSPILCRTPLLIAQELRFLHLSNSV